jgi:hypothetical protein
MFAITQGKGFSITFPNGVVASVQWGTMNYCERQDVRPNALRLPAETANQGGSWASHDAEVMAWIATTDASGNVAHGKTITREVVPDLDDDVAGHLGPDDVLGFLNRCAMYKP